MQYFGSSQWQRWWRGLAGQFQGGNARRGLVFLGVGVAAVAALGISNAATEPSLPVVGGAVASVAVQTPADGTTVRGTQVGLSAAVSQTGGVSNVQFRLDGTDIGLADSQAPYTITWDTTAASEGAHRLTAVVRDAAGRSAESPAVTVTVDNVADTTATVERRIAGPTDDAEQAVNGAVVLNGTTLDLVRDSTDQTVGLRFGGVAVPRGVTIRKAHVQFTAARPGNEPTALIFRGIADDDAATFTDRRGSLSERARTTANTVWTPGAWNRVQDAGEAQRSGDLSAIVSEVTRRSGWKSGNALALIATGSGARIARSYDASPDWAPVLHIEYELDRQPPTTPTGLQAERRTSGLVTLRWQASSDDVALEGYRIYRDGVRLGIAGDTTFGDMGAAEGTSHTYSIEAYDTSGNSSARSDAATAPGGR